MSVVTATAGSFGFDCDTQLTAKAAAAVKTEIDASFVLRYVSRSTPEPDTDLGAAEVKAILGAGLALMPVQHSSLPGWVPNMALGTEYGSAMVANLKAIGMPPGVTAWADIEGCDITTPASAVIQHVNAWSIVVIAGGYEPGIYVGYDSILTADQLYRDLILSHYWQSPSTVPIPTKRGYQMIQNLRPALVAGVAVDVDDIMADHLGGLPSWLTA